MPSSPQRGQAAHCRADASVSTCIATVSSDHVAARFIAPNAGRTALRPLRRRLRVSTPSKSKRWYLCDVIRAMNRAATWSEGVSPNTCQRQSGNWRKTPSGLTATAHPMQRTDITWRGLPGSVYGIYPYTLRKSPWCVFVRSRAQKARQRGIAGASFLRRGTSRRR